MRRFWQSLFGRKRLERELDEELRYHLDNETARNVAGGMTPDDAALAARRTMGHLDSVRETVRDAWGLRWLHELGQDASYSLRAFLRAPGFTITVVLTIALGLGLNGTIFMLFNGYVLRPLAVRDPGTLYQPFLVDRRGGIRHFTWPEVQSLKSRSVFTQSAAFRFTIARLNGQLTSLQLVTGDYFTMLGVGPSLGRMIEPEDDAAPGAGAVVVLSYQLWHSRFGGDSSILGRHLVIKGVPLVVVGVASPGYLGQFTPIDCWVPLTMTGRLQEGADLYGPEAPPIVMVMGRLRPGLDARAARVELSTWARAVTAERPESDRAREVRLESRGTMIPLSAEVLAVVLPIAVAFGLVLLIACANVANMMLARGMARQREIGIRLSLGAGRARLIRQLLTESVLLAAPAALTGLLLARGTLAAATRIVLSSMPSEFAPLIHVAPLPSDARVLGFTFASAVVAAVLFGLAPALQSTRAEVVQATRGNFDTPTRSARLRNTLVVAQITVCVLLLVVAAVLLRGARQMERLDDGVRSRDAIELTVAPRFRAQVLARLAGERAVTVIAAGSAMPFGGIFPQLPFGDSGTTVRGGFNLVTPSYFTVLDLALLRGRSFTANEARSAAPVAVVSEAAARALWPGRDAVGQTVSIAMDPTALRGGPLAPYRSATVVGVARNAVAGWLGLSRDWPVIYYPASLDAAGTTLLIRIVGDPRRELQRLDQTLAALDSGAVEQIHTEADLRAVQVYPFRAAYWVSSLLGGVALLLTITGVYGVLAYVVERRTREVGIRMALGASTRQVVRMVLRELAALAVVGIVIGAGLALGTSKLLNTYLFMIDVYDPVAYGGGIVVVLCACLAAAVVPSRRAAQVEPVTALRHD